MADANVYIRYLADASKLVTESRKASRATDTVGRSAKDADRNFGRFAGRVAGFVAGSAAIAGITNWARAGIELADTADLVRVSWDKTFGESGPRVISNLEDTRRALGLAEFEMQKLLGATGELAQQQGLTQEESAKFSEKLFIMAGDLAAFTGELDAAPEVLGAFQAALRGEFDPLEQYGIKLSQAAINQKALEMTGKASADQLTEQEKITATLALITEAMANETGALTEAQEMGATAVNELNADLRDQQERVGQAGQELRNFAVGAMAAVLKGLENLGIWIGRNLRKLEDLANQIGGPIGAAFRTIVDFVLFITSADPSRFFTRMGDGLREVIRLWRKLGDIAGGVISKIGDIGGGAWRNTIGRLPGFAGGGIVPGPTGQARLALVHGGERVQTPQQQRQHGAGGMGGGVTYNIHVTAGLADPVSTANTIVDLLRLYQRTQGQLPAGTDVGT